MPREIHWLWILIAALVLVAGLVWWSLESDRKLARAHHSQAAGTRANRGPTLYRWVDAGGVVNITDTPPKGRRYSIVHIDPDRNLVPMSASDSASMPAAAAH